MHRLTEALDMAIRRLLLFLGAPLLILLATACGGSDAGAVHVAWQSRDGGPVRLQLKGTDTYQTDVVVRNGTGETLRDARLHLKPHNPLLGIEISGTVTNTRTVHGYDGDYWLIGDLRPGASLSFPIGLWIETSPQLTSASSIELTIELVSRDLGEPLVSSPLRVEAN
jgi:hypothetical protein